MIPRRFVKNVYTEFHENPTNCLVFDAKPERDRQTKMVVHTGHPSPHTRKGRFNQQVRGRNGAWQVTAVLLLSSLVIEDILLANTWGVLVKLLSLLAYVTAVELVPRSLLFFSVFLTC